ELLKNPTLTLLYGYSITACLLFSTCEPDGMGMGILGFNPEVAYNMLTDAGFTRFRQHDEQDPRSIYYEVRV
ncbi:MAG: hypothetical protein GY729_07520, partial [Desulfobacteraceae bacterium]|nr:hypothetical protein [Desulfobacteraceae bacterium]